MTKEVELLRKICIVVEEGFKHNNDETVPIIFICGEPGSGKTHVIQQAIHNLNTRYELDIIKVTPLFLSRPSDPIFQRIANLPKRKQFQHSPSPAHGGEHPCENKKLFFIIEDIHIMACSPILTKDGDALKWDAFILTRLFLLLRLIQYHKECCVLATSRQSIGEIHPRIASFFAFRFFMEIPNNQEKQAIVKNMFNGMSGLELANGITGSDELTSLLTGMNIGAIKETVNLAASFAYLSPSYQEENKTPIITLDLLSKASAQVKSAKRLKGIYLTINLDRPTLCFDDIGGQEQAKEVLQQAAELMVDGGDVSSKKQIMRCLGIDPPSGILLYGPPGTGKTMLAKALAGSRKLSFFAVDIPSLLKAEIGESEKYLKTVFLTAKIYFPSVLFLDEVDALFRKRGDSRHSLSLLSLLTTLMDESMNGEDESFNKKIIVLAATNCPQQLDPSFLVNSRFSHCIYVSPPNCSDRKSILKHYLSQMDCEFGADEIAEELANKTEGYTGADLRQVVDEANLNAIYRNILREKGLSATDSSSVEWGEKLLTNDENSAIEAVSLSSADVHMAFNDSKPSVSFFQRISYENWHQ